MITSWHSYPKLYNLGHAALKDLLLDPVIIEEKIDGSQFSFGKFGGELRCRSKGKEIELSDPEKMFNVAITAVRNIEHLLVDGYTYRAEYLQKRNHNALHYDRIPINHLIIFDINPAEESYLPYLLKKQEAERIGFEVVPLIFEGILENFDQFKNIMETVSILGGQKIEGIVIKNYSKFGSDKKALFGKHVSESFKEVHKLQWLTSNPGNGEFTDNLAYTYKNYARWNKAIQHLKEKGQLTSSPKDIGNLLVEIKSDIHQECEQEIKEKLYRWFLPKLNRISINGFPEWYKQKLAESQFSEGNE